MREKIKFALFLTPAVFICGVMVFLGRRPLIDWAFDVLFIAIIYKWVVISWQMAHEKAV